MRIYCSTSTAVALVAIPDEQGQLLFPLDSGTMPGISMEVQPMLSIFEQFTDKLTEITGDPYLRKRLQWYEFFAEPLPQGQEIAATLYLARTAPLQGASFPFEKRKLPEIINNLPKERIRLPYMKAIQALAGTHLESLKALTSAALDPY